MNGKAPAPEQAAFLPAGPAILTPEGLATYRADLVAKQAAVQQKLTDLQAQFKAVQQQAEAAGQQLVGEFNQLAGQLIVIDRMLGPTPTQTDNDHGKSAAASP